VSDPTAQPADDGVTFRAIARWFRRLPRVARYAIVSMSVMSTLLLAWFIADSNYRSCLQDRDPIYQGLTGPDRAMRMPPAQSTEAQKCADSNILPGRLLY
jgi:hypothetical protein